MCSWTEFLEKSRCVIADGDLRRRAEETAGRKSDGTRIKASAESVLRGHCRTPPPPFTPPHRVLALEMVYVIRILFFLSSEEKPFGGSEALHHQELLCLCFSGPVSPRPGPVSSLPDVPEQRPAVLGGRNRSMQCTSGY